MNHYLETDETEEAIAAVEMVVEALDGVLDDPYRWKWAIVALHASVQGFLVLALRGSNSVDVLSAKEAKAFMAAVQQGKPRPGNRLDTYLNLYSKCKGGRMLKYVESRRFQPQGTQDESIKQLNSLRNEFVHFLPKGWSLEVSGLPAVFEDCLSLIAFLGWDSGNVIWHDEETEQRAAASLGTARLAVADVATAYSGSS